jgi:hypothetical protein
MYQLRFYISIGTFLAISVIMPFVTKVETSLYVIRVGILFIGYLLPSVLTNRMELKKTLLIWIGCIAAALIGYDILKSVFLADHKFFSDWTKFYPVGFLFFMAIHGYSRFISEFVFRQMTRPTYR